jgi:hypothetical protein
MKQREKSLTVPSFGTVQAILAVVAVSIQGTHIVYHGALTRNQDELKCRVHANGRAEAGPESACSKRSLSTRRGCLSSNSAPF